VKLGKAFLILILILALSRILFLDADPSIFKRVGDAGDNGYWSYEARSKAVFGTWINDDYTQSMATAPLYSFLSFITFKSFGVSLFTSRLVIALAGIFSIFLIYFIIKKSNEKLALIASFLLAINNAFFMYNRIGHPETLVIFFLLLNFFFLTSKRESYFNYLFAGVFFMLAILSKVTTIYFSFVMLFYFIGLHYRKELKLRCIISYFIGILIIALPTLFFYYFPLFSKFKTTLINLSGGGGLILIPSNISYNLSNYLSNYYFSLPSIFLLFLLSLLYFKNRNLLKLFSNIKKNVVFLTDIELIAFSWFFGYLVGLLFSDFLDRRFTLLVIPLVLFSSMLFDGKISENFSGRKNNLSSFAIFLLIFLNLFHYPISLLSQHVNLKIVFEKILPIVTSYSTFNNFDSLSLTKAVLIGILLVVIMILIASYTTFIKVKKYQKILDIYLPKSLFFTLILALSLNFVIINAKFLNFLFYITLPKVFIVLISLLMSLLIFTGVYVKNFIKYSFKKVILTIYVMLCIVTITSALLYPSFSVKKASMELSKFCKQGEWVIGPYIHELSFENKIRPLWWIPNIKRYENINKNAIQKYKPSCYLTGTVWDGETISLNGWPTREQVNQSLVHIDSLDLFTIFGKPRVILQLYTIKYKPS